MAVSLLNEYIEYGDWRRAHNLIEYNDVEVLNDISSGNINNPLGFVSPLLFVIEQTDNLIQYPLMFTELFEIFKHLLEKGVDPNNIDVNMNISIFTQIIVVIINNIYDFIRNNSIESTSYFKPFLIELIKYNADWNYGMENDDNAITTLLQYKNNDRFKQAYNRLIDILNEIYFELYENIRLLESNQRLAFAKTGLPQNLMNSIVGELDTDAFNKLGETLNTLKLKDNIFTAYMNQDKVFDNIYDVGVRYDPYETYDEYLENKNWAEMVDFYDQYGGKISQKRYEKLLKENKNKKLTKKNRKLLNKTLNKKYCSCVKKVRRTLNKKQKGAEYPICTKSIYNNRNIKPPKNKNNNCK
jgi:hypothetical protein